jgi:hypothetical protein
MPSFTAVFARVGATDLLIFQAVFRRFWLGTQAKRCHRSQPLSDARWRDKCADCPAGTQAKRCHRSQPLSQRDGATNVTLFQRALRPNDAIVHSRFRSAMARQMCRLSSGHSGQTMPSFTAAFRCAMARQMCRLSSGHSGQTMPSSTPAFAARWRGKCADFLAGTQAKRCHRPQPFSHAMARQICCFFRPFFGVFGLALRPNDAIVHKGAHDSGAPSVQARTPTPVCSRRPAADCDGQVIHRPFVRTSVFTVFIFEERHELAGPDLGNTAL